MAASSPNELINIDIEIIVLYGSSCSVAAEITFLFPQVKSIKIRYDIIYHFNAVQFFVSVTDTDPQQNFLHL